MTSDTDILLEQNNRCGLITFNRPKALNALTYDMIAALEAQYIAWARDPQIYVVVMQASGGPGFCSGGDIRALYEWRQQDRLDTILKLYGTEYQHNWTLDQFRKPHVALIDGIVMGGGVGVSLYGTHRVAGEKYRFAMPEVAIGFFPDVGATHFLPRLKGRVGLYLALTARAIGATDAHYLGLVTHCIAGNHYDDIRAELCEAKPVDEVLDNRHVDPGEAELARLQEPVDRLFAGDSVEAILAALDGEAGTHAEWAQGVAADIRRHSPTALKIAFEQIKRGPALALDEALKLEFRIARRFLEGGEFYEGVRAAIVDKDHTPNWSPGRLEEVSEEMVQAYFAPAPDGDLDLVNPFD